MSKNKKAISPLIATVLLIGFAIAIAILVWFWYGNIIKDAAEKQSITGQGQLTCSSKVIFSVKEASCTTTPKNNIAIFLENKGQKIENFRIRIDGDKNSKTISLGTGLGETESRQTSVAYDSSIGTKVTKIVVTPLLSQGENPVVCNNQQLEVIPKGDCKVV